MRKLPAVGLVFVLGAVFALLILKLFDLRSDGPGTREAVSLLDEPARQVAMVDGGFSKAVKKLAPVVVAIRVAGVRQDGFFLSRFEGEGSGVVISPDGYVVTNAHVVRNAEQIVVKTIAGKEFTGYVVGKDERRDIAVVRVAAKGLAYAELGDSDALQVGEWVLAIGNPLGLENTLTVGVVSAKNRGIGSEYSDLIQTDAAINQGNSGGALANIEGQVVGINTVIISPQGGSIGLGFAVPMNQVRTIVKNLLLHKRTPTPYVGLTPFNAPLTDRRVRAELANISGPVNVPNYGVIVRDVRPYSPGAEAGLRRLDVIMALNDRKLESPDDFFQVLEKAKLGETLTARVWRKGREGMVRLTVRDKPDDAGR